MQEERLTEQLAFVLEIDKLKQVDRQTYLLDGTRKENDAEHSWHLAVMALLLSEYAREKVDLLKVLKMVLLHDLVEIDAGDSFCYDEEANCGKEEREGKAADRLFGLLPAAQGQEFRLLWEEFEARKTPEACFAAALDRLQPLLHNFHTRGKSWLEHGVSRDQVLARNSQIAEGSPVLWQYAVRFLQEAVDRGYLPEEGAGDRAAASPRTIQEGRQDESFGDKE
jgi:putative hydrolases of HD superfamily